MPLNALTKYSVLVVLIFLTTQQVFSQREDYKIRETKASPQIKADLTKIRSRIQTKKLTFNVGYTYALERGVKNISGGKKPNVSAVEIRKQKTLATEALKIDRDARIAAKLPPLQLACSVNLKTWDWRKQGKIPAIRQQQCGNCWAYASAAAYESSYLIKNNKTVDISEQYVVSNNDNEAGDCTAGYSSKANEFLVTNGTTSETLMPDQGITGSPDPSIASPFDGIVWDWANYGNASNAKNADIKQAICDHGAVASWVDAGGTFGAYIGGDNASNDVYNDDDDKEAGFVTVGHYVAIIGWDENRGAWLIRNSWGENWGFEAGHGNQRGYGWLKYGTHNIGSWVSWVEAESTAYKLPPKYYEMIPRKKLPIPIIKQTVKVNPIIKPN